MTRPPLRQTTILGVRHRGGCAVAADGQVTLGTTVVKHKAQKVRRMHNGQVLAGFAGSASDALSLFQRFEAKLEEYRGNLARAAVELSKEWRTDRILRRLEAFLVVVGKDGAFLLSGSGDVIEPDDGLVAVGSGGPYALAAARALVQHTDMDAPTVALEALKIAGQICIYSNDQIVVESL